ncbi:MAG: hypothetical protein KKA60_11330, partial [Proteobacteria bacterium]|nr:hypothetical protein [Pseudomonadota bacterium]
MKPDRRKAAWQEVAQAVERLAGQGLAPVDRDWETLAVLLEAAGPEEAARALATPDHPGLEPAWGFLLQPDSGFQERLEPILARAKLGEEDEESLARHLSGLPLSVRIALPGGGERVLDAPPEAVKSLVRHLGLSACFPPGLAAALDSLEEKTRFHCRV